MNLISQANYLRRGREAVEDYRNKVALRIERNGNIISTGFRAFGIVARNVYLTADYIFAGHDILCSPAFLTESFVGRFASEEAELVAYRKRYVARGGEIIFVKRSVAVYFLEISAPSKMPAAFCIDVIRPSKNGSIARALEVDDLAIGGFGDGYLVHTVGNDFYIAVIVFYKLRFLAFRVELAVIYRAVPTEISCAERADLELRSFIERRIKNIRVLLRFVSGEQDILVYFVKLGYRLPSW